MSDKKIRVRFAPSPTGSLHVGGARTALYNYLFAKKNGGDFIIRIEDTDTARSTQESLNSLLADLEWLGLKATEGYGTSSDTEVGTYGPYKQSERLDIYQKYANILLESGKAYYCFLTDVEIDAQKEQAVKLGNPYQIKSPYRDLPLEAAKEKLKQNPEATIRFKTPATVKNYSIDDLVRGSVTLPSSMVGDFVIIRSGGMPVYNFCCALDDALMNITHVLRGEEHLSNTLRQLMILEELGLTTPKFGHLSIILNEQRKKLSKRDGDVSCNSFKEAGFLPEALLNYIALLGWSSKTEKEIFTVDELVAEFEISSLNAAAPVFDNGKLNWVNAQHIKNMSLTDLLAETGALLSASNITMPADESWHIQALELVKPDLVTLNDVMPALKMLTSDTLNIDNEAQEVLSWDDSNKVIGAWISSLENTSKKELNVDDAKAILKTIQTECNAKGKNLFMPIRTAIIGRAHGYDIKLLISLITVSSLITRAKQCLDTS
jgi:nondiscriminating glutamyl-tRNA synthetase